MTFSYLGIWNGFRVDSILFHSVMSQEMLQIEWKQKEKIKYISCDEIILTSPSKRICPPFDELKKGIYSPYPLYGPVSPSRQKGFFSEMNILSRICLRKIDKKSRKCDFLFDKPQLQKVIEFRLIQLFAILASL